MSDPNLTNGQGPNPDSSGYTPGTKSHVLNELHCMLQELQQGPHIDPDDFSFDQAFELIESVRDNAGE